MITSSDSSFIYGALKVDAARLSRSMRRTLAGRARGQMHVGCGKCCERSVGLRQDLLRREITTVRRKHELVTVIVLAERWKAIAWIGALRRMRWCARDQCSSVCRCK